MYNDSIGIVGGFGAQATIDFFRRLLKRFTGKTEREYPHIYLDCDFTMPSRTRGLLYHEEYEIIVDMIADSCRKLQLMGADYIVLPCGTAHAYLEDVYKVCPEVRPCIINMVETLACHLSSKKSVGNILIIAAEGTLKSELYPKYLKEISCITPEEKYYTDIRSFIEAVKQDKLNIDVVREFKAFLDIFSTKNVILGCTEFPVLVEYARHSKLGSTFAEYNFYDPIEVTIEYLHKILH